MLRVFGDATHSRSVLVTSGTTAHDVCNMLAQNAHCTDEESWALIEHHSALRLGKTGVIALKRPNAIADTLLILSCELHLP